MDDFETRLVTLVIAMVVAVRFGMWLEARRWRRNADDYKRIESGGQLFKVHHE